MKRLILRIAVLACAMTIATVPGLAQSPSGPPSLGSTLKVTVVLSRINGQKKIASLPFVLLMTPTEDRTSVQMSSSVPVPTTTMVQGSAASPGGTVQSYSYQNIGTNMQASAKELAGGQFAVSLTISDSQILTDATGAMLPDSTKGLLKTQSFTSTVRLPLKDAQTISYDAATDKLTGDIVRVEVTLNIMK